MSIRALQVVALVVGVLAVSPAFADCASAMKTTDEMMMKASDPEKKAMAQKEVDMAKDMMAKKDETGCMTHADSAMKALNK